MSEGARRCREEDSVKIRERTSVTVHTTNHHQGDSTRKGLISNSHCKNAGQRSRTRVALPFELPTGNQASRASLRRGSAPILTLCNNRGCQLRLCATRGAACRFVRSSTSLYLTRMDAVPEGRRGDLVRGDTQKMSVLRGEGKRIC